MIKGIAVLYAVLLASPLQAATVELGYGGDEAFIESLPDSLLLKHPIDSLRIGGVERNDVRGMLTIWADARSYTLGPWWIDFTHGGSVDYTLQLSWGGRTGSISGTMQEFTFRIENPDNEAAISDESTHLSSPVATRSIERLFGGRVGDGELRWLADGWNNTGYDPNGLMDSRIYPFSIYHLEFDVTPQAVPAPPVLALLLAAGVARRLLR